MHGTIINVLQDKKQRSQVQTFDFLKHTISHISQFVGGFIQEK